MRQRLKTKEEIEQYFPGFLALVGCTEQPPHTKAKEQGKEKIVLLLSKEKETYSQKPVYSKSKWTDNLQIQAQTEVGMKRDYKVYKDNHPGLPKDVKRKFDLGFFGVEKDYQIRIIHTF